MVDPQEIRTDVARLMNEFAADGFEFVDIFGSAARGEMQATSDIDVLYRLAPLALTKHPGLKFFELYSRVKQRLESRLNCEIDLVDIDSLGPIGRRYILNGIDNVQEG